MMNEMMMKLCCGKEGRPDFEKMKIFMEHCGKEQFSEDEIAMMKEFCGQKGMPDVEKIKQLMEKCECHVS